MPCPIDIVVQMELFFLQADLRTSNRQNSTGSTNSTASLCSSVVTSPAGGANDNPNVPNGSIEDSNSLSTLNEDDTRHEG